MVSTIISELFALAASVPLIVQITIWVIMVCMSAIIILLGYTLILRIRKDSSRRYQKQFRELWRPVLFNWLAGQQDEPPILHKRESELMLELWYDIRRQIDNQSAGGLDQLAVRLELDQICSSILQYRKINSQQRNVWQQMLAVKSARLINTPTCQEALLRAADSNNILINIEATCALVAVGHPRAEYCVLSALMQFDHWVPYIASKVSKSGGADILHLIVRQTDLLNNQQSRNLFSLVEYTDDASLLPLLIRHLHMSRDPEVQGIILRTLGRIGDNSVKHDLIPFLYSEHAWLRIHAIVALGRIGDPADLELLLPLLSDPDWWVRYRAAQTLVAARTGRGIWFEKLLTTLSSDQAREMLIQVMAEQAP